MQNHGVIVDGRHQPPRSRSGTPGWSRPCRPPSTRTAALPDPPAGPGPARARALVDAVGPTLRGLLGAGPTLQVVTFDDAALAASFPATPAGRDFVLGGPLTPDQIVYAGSWPLLVDVPEDLDPEDVPALLRARLDEHVAAHGDADHRGRARASACSPPARRGRRPTPRATSTSTRCGSAQGASAWAACGPSPTPSGGSSRPGRPRPIARASRPGSPSRRRRRARFAGRVALVTGAAQGFGLAIAADLVAQGGHVVLADVNGAARRGQRRGPRGAVRPRPRDRRAR